MSRRPSAQERTIPLSHAGIESQRKRYAAAKIRWRMKRWPDIAGEALP